MRDDKAPNITEENLTMNNLSEYIHQAVGEASTLFYRNKEHIFDQQAALHLAERLIEGVNKLVDAAKEPA
jgi:hypothetical protein